MTTSHLVLSLFIQTQKQFSFFNFLIFIFLVFLILIVPYGSSNQDNREIFEGDVSTWLIMDLSLYLGNHVV